MKYRFNINSYQLPGMRTYTKFMSAKFDV